MALAMKLMTQPINTRCHNACGRCYPRRCRGIKHKRKFDVVERLPPLPDDIHVPDQTNSHL